jgi:hypothetical protein
MAKAESDSSQSQTESLTVRDLRALADRLGNRGRSLVFADQPQLQADLKLAADVIRALVRNWTPDFIIPVGRG